MDQQARQEEVFSFTGFLFARVELERLDTRQAALAYFYSFFCPAFREAVTTARRLLWDSETAPFAFDPFSPERDRWLAPSPFLTYVLPEARVRWIFGEDLPG